MSRRLMLVGVVLSLVVAACGDDDAGPIFASPSSSTSTSSSLPTTVPTPPSTAIDIEPYPTPIVEEYVAGCTTEADEGLCRCTIDEFQQRLSLAEFLELVDTELDASPVVQDIIEICITRGLGDATTTTVGAAATTTTEPEFTSITDIATVTQLTIEDLEQWWAEELPAVFGIAYEGVTEFGPYFISRGDVPVCGGPLLREEYEGNAFYCSLNDTVRWDAETLMAPLFEEFGDYTVALVLAHEWGHAVQERFGFDDFNQPTIVSELQADCLAGSWTGRIAREESDLLRLDPGDLDEGVEGFLLIGDQIGTAPGGPNAHGGSFDRLNAFLEGFESGTTQCGTYEDDPPPVVFVPLREGDSPIEGGDLPLVETAPSFVAALEVFWSIEYPELFGTPWVPVAATVPYLPSTGEFPSCGGETGDASFHENNAFYCLGDDFVAWDAEQWFPDLYVEIGDTAIGLVLAVLWAQAVQNRAGIGMFTESAQLQTSCWAGATIAMMNDLENTTGLILSAGDLEEVIETLLLLDGGDLTAFDRFGALRDGFFLGAEGCDP